MKYNTPSTLPQNYRAAPALGVISARSAIARASGTVSNETFYFRDADGDVRIIARSRARWSPGLPFPKRDEGAEPSALTALCRNALAAERLQEQAAKVVPFRTRRTFVPAINDEREVA
jgi:hypothetical protein